MARYIGPTCKLARREGADLGEPEQRADQVDGDGPARPLGGARQRLGHPLVAVHLGLGIGAHAGVVVLSMSNTPLGFGVTARSTVDTRKQDPTSIIVFHQADVGEYLRDEDTLF